MIGLRESADAAHAGAAGHELERDDVDGGLLVGMGAADGDDDLGDEGPRADGFEADLLDALEAAGLAYGGVRRLRAPEGPLAGDAEGAVVVLADPARPGGEHGLGDGVDVRLGDEDDDLGLLGAGGGKGQGLDVGQVT